MKVRTTRLRRRELALLLVAVALLGALAAGCGSGGEKLSLSLSVSQQICETEDAWRSGVVESYKDEDENWVERETVFGWWRIPSVAVEWRVRGGQAPYTLVIDYESADQYGDYEGASGTAQVGCADASVGTSFWPDSEIGRLYSVDPQVDSGWKTVHGKVTDTNGDSAEANVQFYVILDLGTGTTGDILKRGETYRMYGRLLTAPARYDIRVGGVIERGCDGLPAARRCESASGFSLVGAGAWILLYESDLTEGSRGFSSLAGDDARERASANAALDAFADSLGKLPQHARGSE